MKYSGFDFTREVKAKYNGIDGKKHPYIYHHSAILSDDKKE